MVLAAIFGQQKLGFYLKVFYSGREQDKIKESSLTCSTAPPWSEIPSVQS